VAIQPGTFFRAAAAPVVDRERFTPASPRLRLLTSEAFPLTSYDVLYVPKGVPWRIANGGSDVLRLFATGAPAQNVHPVDHAGFARIAADEWRIRPLKCKDAYLMFDGAEPAVRLVAGYSLSSRMRGVGQPTITPARSIAAARY
jgi:hypothetical protein